MEEDVGRRVADYFVIAGLPKDKDKLQLLDEYSLEVNLKPSAYQDPITDITVIFPSLGENVPDYYQLIDATPGGLSANLNHGSFRSPEVYLCFRRDRNRPPLVDIGVLYDGKERVMPDSQIVEFTAGGHSANVNNNSNSATFLTYRRATEMSPCNELVVMDICVIVASKGEQPPHSFMKIDKSLNKGMLLGSDVFICYKKSMNRADLISYKPSLLSRFPGKNLPSYGLEETVALFCLPMGATLECWPSNSARTAAVTSTFVLTLANRSKVYGSAITFYEELDEDAYVLSDEQKKLLQLHKYPGGRKERKLFTNKCICLLSRWPFFEAFEKFLFFLYKRQLMGPFDVPLERFVGHFLHELPFPSPDRPRILLQLSAEERIALSQPEELPLPRSGASFRNLLTNLGPENCLLVLLLALTEQKILLHSLRPAVLTSVAEAVMQIIFPFYWQCPFIPLCPIGMSDYLAAPLPFVIGLDSRFFDLYDQPSDVNAVDLDTSTVTLCQEKRNLSSKLLPKKASRQLKQNLAALQDKCWQHDSKLQMDDGAIDFEFTLKKKEMQLELEIREAFLHFTVSILSGYRHFLLPITKAPTVGATDVDNLFDQSGFLRSRDRNFHKFYLMLMRTQMFTKFIEERSFVSETNTCLAFFDECVDRTINEEDPKLVELEGFESDRTVFILPPEPADDGIEYRTEQFVLDDSLFPEEPCATEESAEDDLMRMPNTPANLARRTKQEIRSAQKLAVRSQKTPYMWAKCLINTAYSLWFIHLPGYVMAKPQTLRIGLTLLQRMKRLRLHPADEICYRVMMQLCGIYNQPVLAVKVLFEMKNVGLQPNAVTYGYYNKAVLESEWPREDKLSRCQVLWQKLRLVLLAISVFKRVAREGDFLKYNNNYSVAAAVTSAVNPTSNNGFASPLAVAGNAVAAAADRKDEMDGVSQASQASLESQASEEEEKKEEEKEPDCEVKGEEKLESSAEELVTPPPKKEEEEKGGLQFRKRLTSIVKPQGCLLEELTLKDESDDASVAATTATENGNGAPLSRQPSLEGCTSPKTPTGSSHLPMKEREIIFEHQEDDLGVTSLQDLKLEALGEDMKMLNQQPNITRYTEIRGKHLGLINKDKKVNRSLFQTEDNKVVSNNNVMRSESTDSANLEQQVRDFLERDASGSSSRQQSPFDNNDDSSRKEDSQSPEVPKNSLKKVSSSSSLRSKGTPVTENDPLGALSSPPTGVTEVKGSKMTKSATLPSVDQRQQSSSKPDDNILGSPFSEDKLNRSSTLPGSGGSSANSPSFVSTSFRNLTKSSALMSSKLSSLKKISSYSYSAYLSPSAKTQEALAQGIKSAYSVVSKRVEEIRDSVGQQQPQQPGSPTMSPAHSSQYLATPNRGDNNDADGISTNSNESRRHSQDPAYLYANDQSSDTWSSLTGALWEQFWGGQQQQPNLPKDITRASDITEQFENLYSKLPRRLPGPEAVQIQMTSCSRCLCCSGILFDEEIMSGWTSEDSNLNTKCPFCQKMVVPFLTIRVADFRSATTPMDSEEKEGNVAVVVSDHITVPYISPLVLRKELENMLLTEGDQCLLDPACVDSHPIIFWNLLWYFERVAVKSHLPGLCLRAKSLNSSSQGDIHESWAMADHRNVNVKCRWDNERLHESGDPPLYTLWQQDELAVSATTGSSEILVITEKQNPAYRGVMQHIISGVQANDLVQPIKTMLERRHTMKLSSSPCKSPSPSDSSSATEQQPRVRTPRSVYREILFLTLVSLGQDNIDLTAFDREYRRAFERLPVKYDQYVHQCDRPPSMPTIFCRKLFRELKL